MGNVSKPNTFSANTTISSSEVNSNFDTIYNEFNGSVDSTNLAADAVTTAKIADDNVTTAKIADSNVTGEKLGTPVAFRAYANTDFSSSTSAAIVQLNAEDYDLGSDFDTTTYKFTAPYNGVYSFAGAVHCATVGDQVGNVRIYKNGSTEVARGMQIASSSSTHSQSYVLSTSLKLTASDTIEFRFETASASRTVKSGSQLTYFSGHLVGRA